jgi:peptide deformylase
MRERSKNIKACGHCIDPTALTAYIAAMALRDIITLPDPRLRLVSNPVKTVTADIRQLVDDMFETMYDAPGIGLAAIQLGEAQRVVTMDLAKKDDPPEPQVFINPEILWASDEKANYEEGCLSIPEYYAEVERPAQVKVKYLDIKGKAQEIDASGLLATCLQHEIDHLNGVLFIDHISKLKRDRVIKKFIKSAKHAADGKPAPRKSDIRSARGDKDHPRAE